MVDDKEKMIVTETQPMGVSHPGDNREHERRDVNIRAILWSLGGIAITVGLVCLIVWWMFRSFEKREAKFDIPPSPVADTNVVPPQPRLQASPSIDMTVYRKFEDSLLSSYGWVDRPAGVVRIPVDSAIESIARSGGTLRAAVAGAPSAASPGGDTASIVPPPSAPTQVGAGVENSGRK